MNGYYIEDVTPESFVVYVVDQNDTGRLLRSFPRAVRTTRAKAVQVCRSEARAGDWSKDVGTDPALIRTAEKDADVAEAMKASYRAMATHEDYLKQMEGMKDLLAAKITTRPKSIPTAPMRDRVAGRVPRSS